VMTAIKVEVRRFLMMHSLRRIAYSTSSASDR
jgi:hypothetical protein